MVLGLLLGENAQSDSGTGDVWIVEEIKKFFESKRRRYRDGIKRKETR